MVHRTTLIRRRHPPPGARCRPDPGAPGSQSYPPPHAPPPPRPPHPATPAPRPPPPPWPSPPPAPPRGPAWLCAAPPPRPGPPPARPCRRWRGARGRYRPRSVVTCWAGHTGFPCAWCSGRGRKKGSCHGLLSPGARLWGKAWRSRPRRHSLKAKLILFRVLMRARWSGAHLHPSLENMVIQQCRGRASKSYECPVLLSRGPRAY